MTHNLYHVQHHDGPLWVVAESCEDALDRWCKTIVGGSAPDEWEDGDHEPDGIGLVCRDEELILPETPPTPAYALIVDGEHVTADGVRALRRQVASMRNTRDNLRVENHRLRQRLAEIERTLTLDGEPVTAARIEREIRDLNAHIDEQEEQIRGERAENERLLNRIAEVARKERCGVAAAESLSKRARGAEQDVASLREALRRIAYEPLSRPEEDPNNVLASMEAIAREAIR